jgi:hypothetical protein
MNRNEAIEQSAQSLMDALLSSGKADAKYAIALRDALAMPKANAEPVAFMYEYKSASPVFHLKKMDMGEWKETPLYAHPPQADAEPVLWVNPSDLNDSQFVGMNAVRAEHPDKERYYTLPLYLKDGA